MHTLGGPFVNSSKQISRFAGISPKSHYARILEILAGLPRGKVLDIPTGTGVIVPALVEMGFEVSPCDIDTERYQPSEPQPDEANMNQPLPYQDGEFDHVVCLGGLHRIFALDTALEQFQRILKPEGYLVIAIPNFGRLKRRLRFLFLGSASANVNTQECKQVSAEAIANFRNMLLVPQLAIALERNGFEIVQLSSERAGLRVHLLWPIMMAIRLGSTLFVKGKPKAYRTHISNSPQALCGGPHLIVVSRRTA